MPWSAKASVAPRLEYGTMAQYVIGMTPRIRLSFFAGLLGLAALLMPAVAYPQGGLVGFEKDTLTIETQSGERHEFQVELATDGRQQAQGLMFRQSMAPDAGMLFIYSPPRTVGMWMKNTYIPLDMLFIDDSGRIVSIAERTVPHSLETIRSEATVRAVMEVNGGTTARLGIAPGDRILYSAFDSQP